MKNILLTLAISVFSASFAMAQNPLALCQSHITTQQFESALTSCDEAAKTNSLYGRLGRGLAYMGLMQWGNAVTELSAAIAADGRAADLFVYRGNAYYFKGDYRAAVGDLERAVMLEPRRSGVLQLLITQARAMADITPVPEEHDNRPSLLVSLEANRLILLRIGMALNKEPQAEIEAVDKQALAKIDEALKLNKYNKHAYSVRGLLYRSQKRYDLAAFEYTKAIAIDPNQIAEYEGRAESYTEAKNYPLALADLAKMIEINPKSNQPYIKRAEIYTDLKKDDLAYADLTKVVDLAPKDASGYNLRALHLIRRGDLERALADLNALLKIDPQNDFALSRRCEYFNKKADYAAALKDCTAAIAKNGYITADIAMFERVATFVGLKKYDLALADIATLEKKNVIAKDAILVQRGRVMKAQGKKAEATAAFDAALKENPKNDDARKELLTLKP